jgi:hypothetical protein
MTGHVLLTDRVLNSLVTRHKEDSMTTELTRLIARVRREHAMPAEGTVSESEYAALSIVFRGDKEFLDGGATMWRRLTDEHREVVRRAARARASRAEQAAAAEAAVRYAAKGGGSHKAGRPRHGERPMTAAERKRASREKAGAATLEAIDRAIIAEVQRAAFHNERWIPGIIRAVEARFPDAGDRIAARFRGDR